MGLLHDPERGTRGSGSAAGGVDRQLEVIARGLDEEPAAEAVAHGDVRSGAKQRGGGKLRIQARTSDFSARLAASSGESR